MTIKTDDIGDQDRVQAHCQTINPQTSNQANLMTITKVESTEVQEPIQYPHDNVVSQLVVLVRRDRYATRDKLRFERAASCFLNTFMSTPGLAKGDFQKALRESDAVFKKYQKTGDPGLIPPEILSDLDDTIACLDILTPRRTMIHKEIEKKAAELPVADWWTSHRGLNLKGLGLIIGNVGELSTFNKDAGLWQRFGLRNYNFKAPSSYSASELTKEEWVMLGYSKRRRSVMYTVVDSMLRHQRKVADHDAKPGPHRWEAAGEYGELAINRYVQSMDEHPDWVPLHRERDVNRVVGKRLLVDLRWAWNGALIGV